MPRAYDEIVKALEAKVPDGVITHLEAGPAAGAPYIEGWIAIRQANEILGYDAWSFRLIEPPKLMRLADKPQFWCVGEVSAVFSLDDDRDRTVRHQDIGIAEVQGRDELKVNAVDMAMKGCVTDAMKRCLRAFGAQFGNELYDKATTLAAGDARKANVDAAAEREEQATTKEEEHREPPPGDPGKLEVANMNQIVTWASAVKKEWLTTEEVYELLSRATGEQIADIADVGGLGVRAAKRHLIHAILGLVYENIPEDDPDSAVPF